MRRHRRFEFLASEYLKKEGYDTDVTPGIADWGVDVFAEKDGKRYAVQAKMYGDCKTKINRRMMMELYGVMHYFDCQGAIVVYNGQIMKDAKTVAEKLGIQLIFLDQHLLEQILPEENQNDELDTFETIWSEIRQLEGHKINNARGTQYTIVEVTDGDIAYCNKNGKTHREKSNLFQRIVAHICRYGSVEQCQLRGEFDTYASAFIATVFANLPSCVVTPNPTTIHFKKEASI